MKMPRRFKEIPGMKGFYFASKRGEIYSKPRGRNSGGILKQCNRMGYCVVTLGTDGTRKTKSVHRIIALTFLPNPQKYEQINHKDGNRKNNNLSNLEWCNRSMNQKHKFDVLGYVHKGRKLNKNQVFEILDHPELANRYFGRKFNVGHSTVFSIRKGFAYVDLVKEFNKIKDQNNQPHD